MSYTKPYLVAQVQSSWGEETTYRTRATNINQYLRIKEQDLPIPEREVTTEHAFGVGRSPDYVNDYQKQTVEGSMTIEVFKGEFLGAILGNVVTVGSDPYTHTMTVKEDGLPSFSMQHCFKKSGANTIMEFLGCMVNTATLKASEDNEKLLAEIAYMAATVQDGGASPETITPIHTEPYIFKKGAFSSTSLYSGAKARIYGMEININNKCKPGYTMGYEYYPFDVVPGKVDFEQAKFIVGLEDSTEWDEIIGAPGTSHDFSILFTRAANDTLEISGTAKFAGMPPTLDDNEVRAELRLVPDTLEIEIVDHTAAFPFE